MRKTVLLVAALTFSAFLLSAELSEDSYIQTLDTSSQGQYRDLSLKEVIAKGLKSNYEQEIRLLQEQTLELKWKDTSSSFWLPKLQISLTTDEYSAGRLRSGSLDNNTYSRRPVGTLGIGFTDYTLFNWGIDYLGYLNNRNTYQRNKEELSEEKRSLRHQLIITYFALYTQKTIEKIKRNQLRHASFVYRLNREKVKLRKVGKQEYYQSREEYLRSQAEYYQAKKQSRVADEQMAYLIADPPGTQYLISETINYSLLKINAEEAIQVAIKKNPEILEANKHLENAKRDYEITLRENLPLPKFTLNLGAYNHHFGNNKNYTRFETAPGNSNIDLIASINATWAIWGEGGLLNSRKKAQAMLASRQAQVEVDKATHQASSSIKQFVLNLTHQQKELEILEARANNLQKLFDNSLENYMSKKTTFPELRDSLKEMISNEVLVANGRFEHLQNKILLAQIMGVDEFLGENFEHLAKKEEP